MTIDELLPLYALGALDGDEAAAVEAALAADPAMARTLDALVEAGAALPAALPAVEPAPGLRARLIASAAAAGAPDRANVPAGRFERFVTRFAALFDLAADRARSLLALVDDPAAWQPGPTPGCSLLHFEPSPAFAGADTGFVRLAPGCRFPWHRHTGAEHSLVLAGHADDVMSGRLGPGDEAIGPPDTEHDFIATGDEDFIYAVWVWGVDFSVERPA